MPFCSSQFSPKGDELFFYFQVEENSNGGLKEEVKEVIKEIIKEEPEEEKKEEEKKDEEKGEGDSKVQVFFF